MSDQDYGDPFDNYEEYSEWLMANVENICSGDDLVRHLEAATRFEEFMEGRNEQE